jgi:hypothetical protein
LIFSSLAVGNLVGCALFRENNGPPTAFEPREQIFYGSFDSVWRVAQIALQAYPMRINNMDTGVIETEPIKGYKVWTPPYDPDSATGGLSYVINMRVTKLDDDDRKSVKVSIVKNIELAKDFFSEVAHLPSDGMEEKTILYRIGRELAIDRALERAQNRLNKQPAN